MKHNLNMKQYLGITSNISNNDVIKLLMAQAPEVMKLLTTNEAVNSRTSFSSPLSISMSVSKDASANSKYSALQYCLKTLKLRLETNASDVTLLNAISSVYITSKFEELEEEVKEEKTQHTRDHFFVTDGEIHDERNKHSHGR